MFGIVPKRRFGMGALSSQRLWSMLIYVRLFAPFPSLIESISIQLSNEVSPFSSIPYLVFLQPFNERFSQLSETIESFEPFGSFDPELNLNSKRNQNPFKPNIIHTSNADPRRMIQWATLLSCKVSIAAVVAKISVGFIGMVSYNEIRWNDSCTH